MNKNFVANITANVNKFIANINRAQAAANKLQDNVTVDVEANTAAATAQISKFRLMLKSIPNKFRVRGDVDTSAVSKMNLIRTAMANAGKGVETLRSKIGILPSAFLALAPAAIPVLASIVPAVMAIGNALAVVGGGAIGLAGAFGIAGAGAMAFGAMAMTAYKMLQDGTIQATAQTRAFQTALSSLQTQWQSLVQANSGAIFTTMTNGINIAKTALSGLTPFITGVANSMSTLSAKMLSFFQSSSIANNFFAMFNTIGVQAFNNVMNAVGRFGAGFMAIITQFGPLFSWMAQGLANMSAQFQAWATSVSTANGIKTFISYVQTNLPLIGQIFGNVFKGIFNLFNAFGTNSQTIFQALAQMSARFAQWSATIAQSQGFKQFINYVQTQGPVIISTIGNIVNAVIAFATAMAPVGAAVLSVVSSIAQWVAGFMTANPAITQVVGSILLFGGAIMKAIAFIRPFLQVIMRIGSFVIQLVSKFNLVRTAITVLSAVFGTLSAPMLAVIAAVVAVGAALYLLWTRCETFRNGVMILIGVMQTLGSAIMSGLGAAFTWIGQQLQVVMGVLSAFGSFLMGVFAGQLVSNISRAMSDFVNRVMEGGSNAVNAITDACSNMISAISGFVGDMASAGMDLVKGFINGIKDMAGEAVAAAKNMASEAVATVKSFLKIGSPSKVLKQIGQWLTQGFAIGIEKDIPRVATAVERMLRPVTKGLAKLKTANYGNAQEGASSVYSLMAENMKEATKKIEEIIDKRKSLSKKIAEANKSLAKNMSVKARAAKISNLNKLKAQYVKLGKIAHGQYMKRAKNRNLIREVRPMLIYMTRIAKKREAIAKQLEKAQDKLQAALDKKTDFKNAIRNDLRGYASIMNTGRKTSQGMVKMMTKRLDEIKKYQALIGSLKKRGLNKDTLKEILDAGIEQGSVIAKGLFVGGQDAIKQVNILQSQINKASANMGDANAKHFYQAGVDAAKGIVNGLKAQEKYLKSVAVKIADVISSTIKKRLKIHSPSRVMLDLMRYVGAGLVNGLNTAAKLSAKAASAISAGIESNIDPNVHIADIKTASDLKGLNSTVTQSMITDMSNEDNKNITIVLKSDTDLPAVKTYIERVQGINSGVRVLRKA